MTRLKDIIKVYNDNRIAIRAVSVTSKAEQGKTSIAFGHLLIHPEDFDGLDDRTCKYKIIDERNKR